MRIIRTILSALVVLSLGLSSVFAGGVNYSAYVVYGETDQNPMENILANLYDANGNFIASCITDKKGVFRFKDLNRGESYSVHFTTDLKPFGVDLADAYLLLEYLNGKEELSALQMSAADVNGDANVDYADLGFIVSQWYLNGESFPAGDWVMPIWTFAAGSNYKASNASQGGPDGPITIVSTSDISTELPPVIKSSDFSDFQIREFLFSDNQKEISLPISFVKNQIVYGLGMEMAFDTHDIEIIGLNAHVDNYEHVIENNAFKLSWVDQKGSSFVAVQNLLNLNIKINSDQNVETVLEAISKVQVVGQDGFLMSNVKLNMPKLKKSNIDISVGNAYPNPGNGEVSFNINQAFTNYVDVELYNLSGQLIKKLNVSLKNSKITISTSDLPNGSYLCALMMDTRREVKLITVRH